MSTENKTDTLQKTFTQNDYMEKRCTHRQYYAQFVTPSIKRAVELHIGKDRLVKSTDPHFNDIPP